MCVYFIQIGLISFVALVLKITRIDIQKGTGKRVFLFCSFICLVLIEGLRGYTIGTDTYSYVSLFRSSDYSKFEPLFRAFSLAIRRLTNNPSIYLLACSALLNGFVLVAVARCPVNPFLSVFFHITLYQYLSHFNLMRQGIALAITLVAFSYAREERIGWYLLWTACAILFHKSAVTGLSFLVFWGNPLQRFPLISYHSKIDKLVLRQLAPPLTLLVLSVFVYSISWLLTDIVSRLGFYDVYLGSHYFSSGGIRDYIVSFFFFVAYCWLADTHGKERIIDMTILIFATICSAISLKVQIFDRITLYYTWVSILIYPKIISQSRIKEKRLRGMIAILIALACLLYYIYLLSNGYMRVRDYYFQIM